MYTSASAAKISPGVRRIALSWVCNAHTKGSVASQQTLQPVKKVVFDRLPEGKGAAKTSKPDPSAYRWYGRVRFVQ